MSITKTSFSKTPDGKEVFCYTLDNEKGLKAEILTYGGIVKNLYVQDKDGNTRDVVLGRDTLEEYLNNEGYYGALIGRHANRIAKSTFTLGNKEYKVGANENGNSLHGGFIGFDQKVWDAQESGEKNSPALILTLTSPDGDEGFPGNLDVKVTYTVTAENSLKIHYEAISDKDTLVNMTNHTYFNLNGHSSGDIYSTVLQLNASHYTPNTDECMPNGEVLSVSGTPFDFRVPKPIGQDIHADFEQIQMFSGYDHNFPISGRGYRLAAKASSPESGISMEVYTDKPAMQLYTGNAIEEGRVCKDGYVYSQHHGFCMETQYFPNAMSFSHYPAPILKAGEKYDFTTEYKFV